jgi:hypothetical protein
MHHHSQNAPDGRHPANAYCSGPGDNQPPRGRSPRARVLIALARRAGLDREAHEIPPFGPGAVVVDHGGSPTSSRETNRCEPSAHRSDGGRRSATPGEPPGSVKLAQLRGGLEGPVLVHGQRPWDRPPPGEVPRAQRALALVPGHRNDLKPNCPQTLVKLRPLLDSTWTPAARRARNGDDRQWHRRGHRDRNSRPRRRDRRTSLPTRRGRPRLSLQGASGPAPRPPEHQIELLVRSRCAIRRPARTTRLFTRPPCDKPVALHPTGLRSSATSRKYLGIRGAPGGAWLCPGILV